MSILALPNELLLQASQHLSRQDDFYSLSLVNRHFHHVFDDQLYIFNIKHRHNHALYWGVDNGRIATVRKMLDLMGPGADIEAEYGCGRCGECKRNIDRFQGWKKTCLNVAAKVGQLEIVRLLLDRGAVPSDRALYVALMSGCNEMAKLLLDAGADPLGGFLKQYQLYPALIQCNDKIVALISSHVTNHHEYLVDEAAGYTPLHIACRHGRPKWVRYFLEQGADVNAKDRTGWTALRWALSTDFLFFNESEPAMRRPNYLQIFETVRILVEFGANPKLDIIGGWARNGEPLYCTAANLGEENLDPKVRTLFRMDRQAGAEIPQSTDTSLASLNTKLGDNMPTFTLDELNYLRAEHCQEKEVTESDSVVDVEAPIIWRPRREMQWHPSESDTVKAPPNAKLFRHDDIIDVFQEIETGGLSMATGKTLTWNWGFYERKQAETEAGTDAMDTKAFFLCYGGFLKRYHHTMRSG